jgi:hypothetical protein
MTSFMFRKGHYSRDRLINPTATIYINGRAILCFSVQDNCAEAGFLAIDNHELSFTIYDRECNPVHGTPITPSPGSSVIINSNHPGLGELYLPNPSNAADFEHLLDIDTLHTYFNRQRVTIDPDYSFIGEFYINNARFFNAALSTQIGRVFPYQGNPHTQPVTFPRRIGKVIGAEIADQQIQILINGSSITLNRSDSGAPYRIVIRHKCTNETSGRDSDFERFYDALKRPSTPILHPKLDLEYELSEPTEPHLCEQVLLNRFDDEKDIDFKRQVEKNDLLERLVICIRSASEACQAATKTECPENLRGLPDAPCS